MNPISRRRVLRCGRCAGSLPLLALAGCDAPASAGGKPPFNGIDITGADYARTLSLPDQNGQPRTLADFKGKVTVVFFGYTQCPDVCPTTMAELAQVKTVARRRTASGCRASSSRSTRSATRPRC